MKVQNNHLRLCLSHAKQAIKIFHVIQSDMNTNQINCKHYHYYSFYNWLKNLRLSEMKFRKVEQVLEICF